MHNFPSTIVIRHRKENLKKCSLRGLEEREDFTFVRFPLQQSMQLEGYILLTLNAEEELSLKDAHHGILILDGTWRYATVMEKVLPSTPPLQQRRLPKHLVTAYPRRQNDCSDPHAGLASIEAIVSAYTLLGRSIEGLLEHYYWKEAFLEKNKDFLLQCANEHAR